MDLTLFAFGPCVIAPSHGFTFDRDLALDEKLKKQTFKATEEMIIAGRYVLAFTEDFHSRYMTESFFIHCGAFPSIVELFLWLHLESEQTQYDKKNLYFQVILSFYDSVKPSLGCYSEKRFNLLHTWFTSSDPRA